MRLYAFTSMYLEGIHAGIQTAHLVSELAVKYTIHPSQREIFHTWAVHHKTIFISNGGYASSLRDRYSRLKEKADLYYLPVAKFHESQDALDGAITAIGIIVPEEFYSRFGAKDDELLKLLTECERAR